MLKKVTLFGITYLINRISASSSECRDLNGRSIAQGLHYVPGPDTCQLCVCDRGNPKWCKAVLCSPPQDCKSFRVGSSCCEFICLDDALSNKVDNSIDFDGGTDLGLRLIVSAVTAILSLSLLFFLIHRLRQRKIRGRQNRQLSEDERSLGSIGYIAGSIGYLQGSMGYLASGTSEIEFHYEEPPSHYPLWKPPGNYFPRGEAPPPYEEAVAAARAEAAMIANSAAVVAHSNIPQQQLITAPVLTNTSSQTRAPDTVRDCDVTTAAHRNEILPTTNRNEILRNDRNSGIPPQPHYVNITEANRIEPVGQSLPAPTRLDNQYASRTERYNVPSLTANGNGTIINSGHRTIPKNLTRLDPSPMSMTTSSRRDVQTETAPLYSGISENKVYQQKRSTLPREKILESSAAIRSEVFYEDVVGPSMASNLKDCYNSGLERHRTIPRHLTSASLSISGLLSSERSTFDTVDPVKHITLPSSRSGILSSVLSTSAPKSKTPTGNFSNSASSTLPICIPAPSIFTTTSYNDVPCSSNGSVSNSNTVSRGKSHSSAVVIDESNTGTVKLNGSNLVIVSESGKQPRTATTTEPSLLTIQNVASLNASNTSNQDAESSLEGSYQCLHDAIDDGDGDDYRSECENCKSAHGSRYYLAEEDEEESPNETMTLQRRPLDPPCDTLGHGPPFYRTSCTLPVNTRKHRSTSMHGTPSNHGAREAWFSSMPESTSSESEDD